MVFCLRNLKIQTTYGKICEYFVFAHDQFLCEKGLFFFTYRENKIDVHSNGIYKETRKSVLNTENFT